MLGRAPDPSLRVLVAGLGNDRDHAGCGRTGHSRASVCDAASEDPAARDCMRRWGAVSCLRWFRACWAEPAWRRLTLCGRRRPASRAELVVAVDALAARSCRRPAATVQLSDRGISPGAGIGNMRAAIDRDTVGCPVLALGVPTVVDSATLVLDALEQAGCPARLRIRLSGACLNPAAPSLSPRRLRPRGRSHLPPPRPRPGHGVRHRTHCLFLNPQGGDTEIRRGTLERVPRTPRTFPNELLLP